MKMHVFARAMVCLVSFCSPGTSARAQAQNALRVHVVDMDGRALPGADVRLSQREQLLINSATGFDGVASIQTAPGRYVLTICAAGFAVVSQDYTADGHVGTLEIRLPIDSRTESIEVTASSFKADEQTSASRIPLRVLDTPQSVQTLTSELLRDRAVESMKQAVEVVPAIGLQLGEGRRDNFFIRGFNAVGDVYLDGVRDDAQYYRDLSNTERIEVLEGPAAVLYGRGSSGGLINRITKKPRMEGRLGELSYMAGSFGEQRGAGDLDTLIPGTAGKAGFRLTGAAEHTGSQRHFFWEDRYTFAPTVQVNLDPATTLTAQAERLRDDRLPDRGVPYLPSTGAPARVSVGTFFGYVGPGRGGNFIHSAVTDGTFDLRRTPAAGWNVHAVARIAGYATNFTNMYATNVTASTSTPSGYLVGRGEYDGTQGWQLGYGDVEAYRSFSKLGLGHTLLLGAEYGREATDSTQYNGPTNQTPVDLLNPALVAPVLSDVLSRNNRFLGRTRALYAQDLLALGSHWKVLAGVRFDSFAQTLELRPPTNVTPNLGRTDNAASPRVGLVYEPRKWASVYVNYSRTFDPSGENLSLATNNAQLQPEVTQNYEGGTKMNLLGDRLLVTTSLFRLDRTNIKTTDPNNPLALLNLGEQRTDGAEVSFVGSPARHWQLQGGWAWLDGRIVSSTSASNGVSLQGRRPAMTPLNSGSLWATHTWHDGFGLGTGLVARAAQFASTDNLAKLPAYTRVDATAFYRQRRYEVQINLQNLGNLRYFDAAQSDFQIYPEAGINGTGTVRWRF